MSDEKARSEAQRWLETADGDVKTAEILAEGERWAHSCFHAQQAAEKALKALWLARGREPWGHSVKKLIDDLEDELPKEFAAMKDLDEKAARLDRFSVPTRCPNGLPELTPETAYFRDDSDEAVAASREIIQRASSLVAPAGE